jgi:hypothetical protein
MDSRFRGNDKDGLAVAGNPDEAICKTAAFLLPLRKPVIVAGAQRNDAKVKTI